MRKTILKKYTLLAVLFVFSLIKNSSACNPSIWYRDSDGDGYGNPLDSIFSCVQPSGYVSNNTDCDDTNPNVNPGATEYCNGIDDNCNGIIDNDAVDASAWYPDNDNDGYGDMSASPTYACSQPSGYVLDNTDCDDNNANVFPGATEYCNGIDDDCNGIIDDNAADATLWFIDADGDGYGDLTDPGTYACTAPPNHVADNTDCDDNDASIHPGATEYCNNIDDDCNGIVDDNAVDATLWYVDNDSDGYGDINDPGTASCTAPSGYSATDDDCDDSNASIYPGATEVCNGLDDDCNGIIDDSYAVDASTWYIDADGDGYGDQNDPGTNSCTQPTGYTYDNMDCDDSNPNIYPGATEYCNGLDDDCNGVVDDNAVDATLWYMDNDGDGYGDMNDPGTYACNAPSGDVADNTDCDDTNPNINPGEQEVCNGYDDNCDGLIDDADDPNVIGQSLWYVDADGDGYGDENDPGTLSCNQISGDSPTSDDCDDTNPDIHPGAADICNGIDDNCNGIIDEGCVTGVSTYAGNENEIAVYPNPASDLLNVIFKNYPGYYTIRLADLNGRSLLNRDEENSPAIQLDLSALSKGIYILFVNTGNESRQVRVAVE